MVSSAVWRVTLLCLEKEVNDAITTAKVDVGQASLTANRAVERILRWLCIVLASGYVVLFIALAVLRLMYPYEVEWMEGAMMDHAVRLLDAKPIYTAPSIDFVAWLYPPLYYYAVAAVMKLVGVGWFAGRIVSFASTILTAVMLAGITKKITGDNLLAFFSFALYLATYHATGFYFDIVRNDAFFTLLLVAAAWSALMTRGMPGVIASALIMFLAIATKQQAIFFLPAMAIWYWLRDKRSAIVFSAIALGLAGIGFLAMNAATSGWLSYYLLQIPRAKRADFVWMRTLDIFPQYAFGVFTASSLALFALIVNAQRSTVKHVPSHTMKQFWSSANGLLAMLTFSALAAGAMSLGNEGGYANVMMPFAAFVTSFLPIAIREFSSSSPIIARYAYGAILFQLIAFFFNPFAEKMLIASEHQKRGGDEFFRQLRAIPGEVLIPYHGFIARQAGKPSHAHVLASLDVLRMHDTTARRLQANFDTALAHHRFSAVILEEAPLFTREAAPAHYTFARTMLVEPNVYLTRVRDEATRPQFVFVPK